MGNVILIVRNGQSDTTHWRLIDLRQFCCLCVKEKGNKNERKNVLHKSNSVSNFFGGGRGQKHTHTEHETSQTNTSQDGSLVTDKNHPL